MQAHIAPFLSPCIQKGTGELGRREIVMREAQWPQVQTCFYPSPFCFSSLFFSESMEWQGGLDGAVADQLPGEKWNIWFVIFTLEVWGWPCFNRRPAKDTISYVMCKAVKSETEQ